MDDPDWKATWGKLLEWIERVYITAGHCITRVMMNGNEITEYRAPGMTEQLIEGWGDMSVVVTTGEFDTVVRESLTELESELKKSMASVGEIVRLLENRREEEAYKQLAQLLESIKIFHSILSEDLGWAETPAGDEISTANISASLERALAQLAAAQENRFWVSVCDVLEYEITPILESWHLIIKATRASLPPKPSTEKKSAT